MKKQLITLFALAATTAATAQISVTSSDLVFPVGNDSVLIRNIDVSATIALPQDGVNQLWDYSTLVATDSANFGFSTSDGLHTFTNATSMDNEALEFGNFSVENTTYFTQNNNGFFTSGYFIPEQGFEIGDPGDTLILTGDTIDLIETNPMINFPVTYSDIIEEEGRYQINFELTYGAFPPNTPGYLQRDFYMDGSVAGWGSLVYPGSEDTIDVLLIYKEEGYEDSVYAGGMPISNTILAGTGLEQGMFTQINTMEFVALGTQMPVLSFRLNQDADTIVSGYYTSPIEEDTTISIRKIENSKLNFYPNPAKEYVSIDLSGKNIATNNVVAEIYALDGRKVADRKVANGMLAIKDLSNAAYVVRIVANNEFVGYFRLVKDN